MHFLFVCFPLTCSTEAACLFCLHKHASPLNRTAAIRPGFTMPFPLFSLCSKQPTRPRTNFSSTPQNNAPMKAAEYRYSTRRDTNYESPSYESVSSSSGSTRQQALTIETLPSGGPILEGIIQISGLDVRRNVTY
jgi:hypothetical protein